MLGKLSFGYDDIGRITTKVPSRASEVLQLRR